MLRLAIRLGMWLTVALTELTMSRAEVIQATVELPSGLAAYTFGPFCLDALDRCTTGATVSGFTNLVHTQSSGNELIAANATYSADIYTEVGGNPGSFVGTLTMPGFVNFTYVGRNPGVNPLGSFSTIVTDFGFSGLLNGNTFEIKKDPGQASTGSTTILQFSVGPPVLYSVNSTVSLLALYSFNGSPFLPAPERTGTLAPIPEPASGALALAALAGIAIRRFKRRR